jgi:hypothetical protein
MVVARLDLKKFILRNRGEYMIRSIDNVLLDTEIQLLKNILPSDKTKIGYLEGEYTPIVFIEGSQNSVYLINMPSFQSDGDEYPKMTVLSEYENSFHWNKSKIVEINKLFIIRDTVSWKREEQMWNVTVDVGIKLCLDKSDLIILAIDSLAGLIKVFEEKSQYLKHTLLQYWSFKTDEFLSAERNEIEIT